MFEKFKDGLTTIAVWGLLIGVPVALSFVPSDGDSPYSGSAVEEVCTIDEIPYEEVEEETYSLEIGDNKIETPGRVGELEVCKKDGIVVSEEIITQPRNQVTLVGVGESLLEPDYNTGYRTGAYCNDGSYSTATGRGACSWHGGVSEWLYN
jgi:hypothetical protein